MLLCLIVQVAVAFWCVRYYAPGDRPVTRARSLATAIRPLTVAMLAMMSGNRRADHAVGIAVRLAGRVRGGLPAIYHSAVNFTSLGYGDIVMKQEWKLLGPLEAANGVLMLSMSAAALTAILQHIIRSQAEAIGAGQPRRRE